MTQGIRNIDALRTDFRPALFRTNGDGRAIGPGLPTELLRGWERLRVVISIVKVIERERDARRAAIAEPKVQLLQRLQGVGPALATVFAREVFTATILDC
jgi:hypothetical protein